MELGPRRFAETVVLSPVGRIDHATAEAFKTALLAQLDTCAPGRDRQFLDLGGVEYIASVGLQALMLAARQAGAGAPRGRRAPAPGARGLRDQPFHPALHGLSVRPGRAGRPRRPVAFDAAAPA
jgi:anti-anti-sigma factor